MVNEEIITGLKNAIERGETLENAMQVMLNSGYNAKEVKEASVFIGTGILNIQQPRPAEHLAMPEKKSFFSRFNKPQQQQQLNQQQTTQQNSQQSQPNKQQNKQQYYIPNPIQQPIQEQVYSGPISNEIRKIKPTRQGYLKEIILLITLLVLVGILIVTIVFKNTILDWFV
jgi:hypothetical protein